MHITDAVSKATNRTPTEQSYGELSDAYKFFNAKLFDDGLPSCLITLHRHRSAYGYFSPKRFESADAAFTDEIALNPDHFKARPDRASLSTLVHEMVHLWQQHFGKPSRNGYHNKEWAAKMDELGLTPSSTGAEGGARTGQKVSHFIVDGGPFDLACAELMKTGFTISWKSVPAPPKIKAGKRTKYKCPGCETSVWGKDGLSITCEDCSETMEAN